MGGYSKIDAGETDINVLHSEEISKALKNNNDALTRGLPLFSAGGSYLNGSTIYDDLGAYRYFWGQSLIMAQVESIWVPDGVDGIRINLAATVGGTPTYDQYFRIRLINLATTNQYWSPNLYTWDFTSRFGTAYPFYEQIMYLPGGANYQLIVDAIHVTTGFKAFYVYTLHVLPQWS